MDWTLLWKTMLVVMLGLFAVMAVLGTVLGGRDVRRLLAHLRDPDSDSDSDEDSNSND